jgi:hypothetical protein
LAKGGAMNLRRVVLRASNAIAITLAAVSATVAVADEPPFLITRYDEDYRYLAVDGAPTDFYDRFKYIRLPGEAWLSLGGEVRERYDVIDAARYGIGAARDAYLLQRLMLHADLHVNEGLRVFVQFGQEDAYGKVRPLAPSDANHVDLQNAFVDLKPFGSWPLTVRLGRQELMLNPTQRFVSVREGPNLRQSFDGVRATWSDPAGRIDVFATRPVNYKPDGFDDAADRTQGFSGIYASKTLRPGTTLDAYAFFSSRDGVTFGTTTGDERRQTWGARLAGRAEAFDFDTEGAYQTGSFAGRDVRAWAVSAITGYTLEMPWKPRLGGEFDAGSGDRGDGTLRTFNPLFPKGAYFNESATVSWANLTAARVSLTVQPESAVSLSLSVMERWRQSGRDAVYLQPFIALAATRDNTRRRVGEGYQLDASWKVNRHLGLSAQVLRQTAGPAITEAGGRTMDFAMLIGQLKF